MNMLNRNVVLLLRALECGDFTLRDSPFWALLDFESRLLRVDLGDPRLTISKALDLVGVCVEGQSVGDFVSWLKSSNPTSVEFVVLTFDSLGAKSKFSLMEYENPLETLSYEKDSLERFAKEHPECQNIYYLSAFESDDPYVLLRQVTM